MFAALCLAALVSGDASTPLRSEREDVRRTSAPSFGVLVSGGALLQHGEAVPTTGVTLSLKLWRHVAVEAAYQHAFDAPAQISGGPADLNLVLAGIAGMWGETFGPIVLGRAGIADGKGGISPAFSVGAGVQLQHAMFVGRLLAQSTLADVCYSNLVDSNGCTKLNPTPGVVAEVGARF